MWKKMPMKATLTLDQVTKTQDIWIPPTIQIQDSAGSSQSRVSEFFQKHIQRKFSASNHEIKTPLSPSNYKSCPNLYQRSEKEKQHKPLQMTRSSDATLCKTQPVVMHPCENNESKNVLKVPDCFITSKTYANPPPPTRQSSQRNLHNPQWDLSSQSAPNLKECNKPQLIRKMSEGSVFCNAAQEYYQEQEELYQELAIGEMYSDEQISQILDFLYIGNIESAYNELLLCKLNINSILDMSNLLPDEVPKSKKSVCPCTCSLESSHSRVTLRIGVKDEIFEDLNPYFEEINRFIEGAKKRQHNVLVHSFYGKSRAPAAVIQYLMQNYYLSFQWAYCLIKKRRPAIAINPGFQTSLEKLEFRLIQRRRPSLIFCFESSSAQTRRQHAWL